MGVCLRCALSLLGRVPRERYPPPWASAVTRPLLRSALPRAPCDASVGKLEWGCGAATALGPRGARPRRAPAHVARTSVALSRSAALNCPLPQLPPSCPPTVARPSDRLHGGEAWLSTAPITRTLACAGLPAVPSPLAARVCGELPEPGAGWPSDPLAVGNAIGCPKDPLPRPPRFCPPSVAGPQRSAAAS